MKTINVKDKTKERFEESMAIEIGYQKRVLYTDEFLCILLDLWDNSKTSESNL